MAKKTNFSENPRINILIENILNDLCPFLEQQAKEISELTTLGKALGTGKDISVLLEMILSLARKFTNADGGTLYLVDNNQKKLVFTVIQNKSLEIKKTGSPINLPGVSLYHGEAPNLTNVSAYAFHTGEIINIKDVYKIKKFQFKGTKQFDASLHYRSKSMIVIPMRNHEDDIIGILQLINATNISSNKTISFSKEDQDKAAALASQASVILTQQFLILEMRELFEAFIKAIAISIDEKSKHTGGHIQRVTELCMMLAQKINEDKTYFKNQVLSDDQMDELRMAALMHDTGKITTPDHVMSKSTRLETLYDRIELIKVRFDLFKTHLKLLAAEEKLSLFDHRQKKKEIKKIDRLCSEKIKTLEKEFETLSLINKNKQTLDKNLIGHLKEIYKKIHTISGRTIPYLSDDEFDNLSIPQGTLTPKERKIINNHAYLTTKILDKLPWPKKLSNLPSIAGAHHEKLDGSGYPLQLKKNDLNMQARILSIADIFEALSAPDRPYKEPMKLSQTVKLLTQMGEKNHIDRHIVTLFFKSNTHIKYAKKYLSTAQFDL